MTIIDAIGWWYGWGWMHILTVARRRLTRLYNVFSVRQMLRTLFAPWKEDRVSGAQGLDQMMRALLMNSVARLIGFCVRVMFLVFYVFLTIGVCVIALAAFVIWPVLPALVPGLIIVSLAL